MHVLGNYQDDAMKKSFGRFEGCKRFGNGSYHRFIWEIAMAQVVLAVGVDGQACSDPRANGTG